MLGVSRAAVDKGVRAFQERRGAERGERGAEASRWGRPRTAQGVRAPLLDAVLDQDPRGLGSRSTVGRAPWRVQYGAAVHPVAVSRQRVGLAIARRGSRWKPPRHQRPLRSPTWRQAKGGASGAWPSAAARCSCCWRSRSFARRPHGTVAMAGGGNKGVSRLTGPEQNVDGMAPSTLRLAPSCGSAPTRGGKRPLRTSSP